MTKIHGNGFASFRFFTPFPHYPPQPISEGQWREKTIFSGFWIQKHASFSPASTLEGEQLRFPPSNIRLASLTAPCLPFSDAQTPPASQGAHPLGIPTDLGRLSRPQIRQKRLGFRLLSPLPRKGTVPAPPSNGFFHPKAFAKEKY